MGPAFATQDPDPRAEFVADSWREGGDGALDESLVAVAPRRRGDELFALAQEGEKPANAPRATEHAVHCPEFILAEDGVGAQPGGGHS
jgi:hypothetical protein